MREFIHRLFKIWSVMMFIMTIIQFLISGDIEILYGMSLFTICITLIAIAYGKENKD